MVFNELKNTILNWEFSTVRHRKKQNFIKICSVKRKKKTVDMNFLFYYILNDFENITFKSSPKEKHCWFNTHSNGFKC
jgi:hypothetical protein